MIEPLPLSEDVLRRVAIAATTNNPSDLERLASDSARIVRRQAAKSLACNSETRAKLIADDDLVVRLLAQRTVSRRFDVVGVIEDWYRDRRFPSLAAALAAMGE